MANITDLTNTKWYFNEYCYIYSYYDYRFNINFETEGTLEKNHTSFSVDFNGGEKRILYNNTIYYSDDRWHPEGARTIYIIDGEDVTNTRLIKFLTDNAVQIELPHPNTITNLLTNKQVAGWKNASGSELVKMTRVEDGRYIILGDMPKEEELYFEATEPNSSVQLTKVGNPYDIQLVYSTGDVYKDYTIGTAVKLPNVGDRLWIRAKNFNNGFTRGSNDYYRFVMTGSVNAFNSIQYLLDKTGQYDSLINERCFQGLFRACKSLKQAPEMTAEYLTSFGYVSMYRESGIKDAPALNSTHLADNCYSNMFRESDVETQSNLPDTTLYDGCYDAMYYTCPNIQVSKVVNAQVLATNAMKNFNGKNSSLKEFELMATDIDYTDALTNCLQLTNLLEKITVHFTNWGTATRTSYWVNGVPATGDFYCPQDLPIIRGNNNIPTGWTVHLMDENWEEVEVIPPTNEELERAKLEYQAYQDFKNGNISASKFKEITGYEVPNEVKDENEI